MSREQGALIADIEAEEALFACLLTNPRQIRRIADRLKPEHFYRDVHREMYQIALTCYQAGRVCTIDTMYYELKRRNMLDEIRSPLGVLADSLLSMRDVEELATTIISEHLYRSVSYLAQELHTMAYQREEGILAQAQAGISDLMLGADARPSIPLAEAIDQYMSAMEVRRKESVEGKTTGLSTGFRDLDHLLRGLHPSRLYTLAALTGIGKTSLAVSIALSVTIHAKRALFFSLEMDTSEIVQRILSMETEIDQSLLQSADLDEVAYRALTVRAQKLKTCDFLLNDRVSCLSDVVAQAKKEHARKKLDLIVLDYVQLMEGTTEGRRHETRAEEIAKLSKGLKRLARELRVPILALAQVNRDVEKRTDPEPKLSDLNESGGIARDSDCVMFLYATQDEMAKGETNQPYTVWVSVRKHRHGRRGQIPLYFAPRITRFRNDPSVHDQEEESPNDGA